MYKKNHLNRILLLIRCFIAECFHCNELDRLSKFPRYTPTTTSLLGKKINLIDSASFLSMYGEILKKEIYRFNSSVEDPYILDCGANIGLSIIYFKSIFPRAKIVGFEPDPMVFETLEHNIKMFDYSNVTLISKAVWNGEETLNFFSEGADGGRIIHSEKTVEGMSIETVRLKDYLNQYVNLLKIDIEGAETTVLNDCRDALENVQNIFIEYHSFQYKKQTLQEILEILTTAQFRYYIDNVGIISKQPFSKINTNAEMDLQVNIYGYRV